METSRKNVKLVIHLMPWELDFILYYFTQLKKSKYYLPKDIKLIIDIYFNFGDHFIDWETSKLSKDFFQKKISSYSELLYNCYQTNLTFIGGGDVNIGHLNAQKNAVEENIDYYILSSPDIMFDERLLAYLFESLKLIKEKYFLVTPQISKMWDSSWDLLVNDRYKDISYEHYIEKNCFDIIFDQINSQGEIKLKPLSTSKFAGWFDLVSKDFYEQLVPVWEEWNGYGGWDYYSMMVSDVYKRLGGDFQQYLLEGQVITEWYNGKEGHKLSESYKRLLCFKETPKYGEIFKQNVVGYAEKRIQELVKELGVDNKES